MVAHGWLGSSNRLNEGAGADLALWLGRDQAEKPEACRIRQGRKAFGQFGGVGFTERRGQDRRAASL